MSCAVRAGADPSCQCHGHGDFVVRASPDDMFGGCLPCPNCFPRAAAERLARFDVSMLKEKGFSGTRMHDTKILAGLARERPHHDLKSLVPAAMKTMRITDMLQAAVTTDGGHHKQWYLERLAEALEIELPEHDEGIAP